MRPISETSRLLRPRDTVRAAGLTPFRQLMGHNSCTVLSCLRFDCAENSGDWIKGIRKYVEISGDSNGRLNCTCTNTVPVEILKPGIPPGQLSSEVDT